MHVRLDPCRPFFSLLPCRQQWSSSCASPRCSTSTLPSPSPLTHACSPSPSFSTITHLTSPASPASCCLSPMRYVEEEPQHCNVQIGILTRTSRSHRMLACPASSSLLPMRYVKEELRHLPVEILHQSGSIRFSLNCPHRKLIARVLSPASHRPHLVSLSSSLHAGGV